MEKISDTQIKFILTKSDLISRNLSLNDLVKQNEKTSKLFKEILDKAVSNFDLKPDANPFMIEAMPMNDGIMVLISKVEGERELKGGLDFLPETIRTGRFRQGDFIDVVEDAEPVISREEAKFSIFAFDSIDSAALGAKRIESSFEGESSLYKLKNDCFLIIKRRRPQNELHLDIVEAVLSEYGRKQTSTSVSAAYIKEHGEAVIADKAVDILSKIF